MTTSFCNFIARNAINVIYNKKLFHVLFYDLKLSIFFFFDFYKYAAWNVYFNDDIFWNLSWENCIFHCVYFIALQYKERIQIFEIIKKISHSFCKNEILWKKKIEKKFCVLLISSDKFQHHPDRFNASINSVFTWNL